MAIKGGFLRLSMIGCYFIAFLCATVITGAFAWFTATQFRTRNIATLAIAAITMLYTLASCILTCCTAGIPIISLLNILGDLIFMGGMIAVAILNRSGRFACDGSDRRNPRVNYEGSGVDGCRLFRASFAVAIVAALMFLFTIVLQMVVRRRGGRDRKAVVGSSKV